MHSRTIRVVTSLVSALLIAGGLWAPSAGAAVGVTNFAPNIGSIVSIAFDPESRNLFLYPEHGTQIFEYQSNGTQVDGIPVPPPGSTSNDIDLDFTTASMN